MICSSNRWEGGGGGGLPKGVEISQSRSQAFSSAWLRGTQILGGNK